jgi:hypothetical protein
MRWHEMVASAARRNSSIGGRAGFAGFSGFSEMGRGGYFRLGRRREITDKRDGKGRSCVLWGEPGASCARRECGSGRLVSDGKGSSRFFPKWVERRYFRFRKRSRSLTREMARVEAACCGVNLTSCGGRKVDGKGSSRFFPKWVERRYFRLRRRRRSLTREIAKAEAACCGVNLAPLVAGGRLMARARPGFVPKWVERRYFRLGARRRSLTRENGKVKASCCGVNLAPPGGRAG